jgi:hypothetical protein
MTASDRAFVPMPGRRRDLILTDGVVYRPSPSRNE